MTFTREADDEAWSLKAAISSWSEAGEALRGVRVLRVLLCLFCLRPMDKQMARQRASKAGWIKHYVVGVGLGAICAVYGVVALLVGKAFLPGLPGNDWTVKNRSGIALSLAYLIGGVFLLLRLPLRRLLHSERAKGRLCVVEVLLLLAFIGALVYVLIHMGASH